MVCAAVNLDGRPGARMTQISVYLPGIILAYSAFLLAIMSPGPNVLAVMGTSMALGRKAGTDLALGVGTGSFLWSLLTVAGLSTLLVAYAEALIAIKIAGGLYLLWLAFKAFRSAASARDIDVKAPGGEDGRPIGFYMRGLTIQMTNPKAVLAWIAIVSLGLQENAPMWVGVSIVAGTSALSVLIHCGYALLFSTAPMVRLYAKARRWIQAALGAFFAIAGIRLLTSRT
jgi:threonine/homoserine/homoserine lactone efflux protein